jgi:hypothetical protein
MKKALLALLALTAALGSYEGYAQGVTTANMSGLVTEVNGQTVPGASVVAVHMPSGTTYGTITREDGRYSIPNMRVGGPYRVTITFVGFQEYIVEEVYLSLGSTTNINASIQDDVTQLGEIIISGQKSPVFNSDRTGAGINLNEEALTNLPTINRSLNDFTRLTPQSNGTSFGGRDNRFNNYTIDGNIYNNNFGLGTSQFLGGNPISLDAIEEVQVNLAPYDVRQGGFTGANVNAITKSGSNVWKGSVYQLFRNEKMIGDKIGDTKLNVSDAFTNIRGFTVGGPIIKNKLFFFAAYEKETADNPGDQRRASRPGLPPDGQTVSRVPASEADFVRESIRNIYGYDPGTYENIPFANEASRLNLRLDFNLNEKNKLMLRYNSFTTDRSVLINGNSIRGLPASERFGNTNRFGIEALTFANGHYLEGSDVTSWVAEVNSVLTNRISNNLNVGYTKSFNGRRIPGGQKAFPMIEIMQEDDSENLLYYMSLGDELFSVGNELQNNIFNITNNLTYFGDKHTITAGFNFEYMTFGNGFNPTWNSWYRYKSYDSFVESVINNNTDIVPDAFSIGITYDRNNPTLLPLDNTRFAQLGLYIQDEFYLKQNLKITAGLRVDMPFFPGVLPRNTAVEEAEFALTNPSLPGKTIRPDVSDLPGINPLFSPRVGFNYDINGDQSIQLRGGTGVFSGRMPFVWISNQVNANGVMRDQIGLLPDQWGTGNNPEWQGFQPDVNFYRPDPNNIDPRVPVQLNITDKDFKFPQVWRSNLAVDAKLPFDIIGSLEGIYSKDFNQPLAVNLAHNPTGQFANVADNEYPLYQQQLEGEGDFTRLREVYMLTNINAGSYASITARLDKDFGKGFNVSFAYTKSRTRDYGLIGGSQAQSLWPNVAVRDRNRPETGFGRFDQPNRIVSYVSFDTRFLNPKNNTRFTLFYDGGEQGRYSYTYSGNMGDGVGVRLMYVPRNIEEAQLIDLSVGGNTITAQEQWDALDAYISQSKYLSSRRGEITERNGAKLPWLHRFDFRMVQDFHLGMDETKNKLQFTVDILNVGNLINSKWGVGETTIQSNLMQYRGRDGEGNAEFTANLQPGTQNFPRESFRSIFDITQTWSAQIGIRYIFN